MRYSSATTMCSVLTRTACGILLAIIVLAATPVCAENNRAHQKLETIDIEITTHLGDKQTFLQGDIVSFFLSLDKAAYILVVYQDAAANRFQVIPNRYQQDHHYQAGLFIAVPPAAAGYQFRVSAPFGEETLWVIASDNPVADHAGKYLGNGLKKLNASIDGLRDSIKQGATAAYGEAHLSIITRASP